MDIEVYEGVDEKFIRELVEPYTDILKELMELVEKFDDELNNITNEAHLELVLNLDSGRIKVYNYDYYAVIHPDCIKIYCDEYTDFEQVEGVSRKIYMATVYL